MAKRYPDDDNDNKKQDEREQHKEFLRKFRNNAQNIARNLFGDKYEEVANQWKNTMKPLENTFRTFTIQSTGSNSDLIFPGTGYILGSDSTTPNTTVISSEVPFIDVGPIINKDQTINVDNIISKIQNSPSTEEQGYILDILIEGGFAKSDIENIYVAVLNNKKLPCFFRETVINFIENNNILTTQIDKVMDGSDQSNTQTVGTNTIKENTEDSCHVSTNHSRPTLNINAFINLLNNYDKPDMGEKILKILNTHNITKKDIEIINTKLLEILTTSNYAESFILKIHGIINTIDNQNMPGQELNSDDPVLLANIGSDDFIDTFKIEAETSGDHKSNEDL